MKDYIVYLDDSREAYDTLVAYRAQIERGVLMFFTIQGEMFTAYSTWSSFMKK